MKNKKIFGFMILPLLIFFTVPLSAQDTTPVEAESIQGKNFLENVNKIYAPYKKVAANFIIKGKVDDAEIYFLGTLEAIEGEKGDTQYLSILLKDTVFESNVYQMIIKEDMVTNIDYLNDTKETISLARFTWAQVLGSVFPFRFFYPLLSGFPPFEIYSGVVYPSQNKIINNKGKFDVAVTFKNYVMENIYVKNLSQGEVIVFRLSGQMSKKTERYFPKRIFMERSKKKDRLEIIFTYLNIR